MNKTKPVRLTSITDWDSYHRTHLEHIKVNRWAIPILNEYLWAQDPGKYFELGCGSSPFMIKSALLGWKVSGIDFHLESIKELSNFFRNKKCKCCVGSLIHGDVLRYDCRSLHNKFDVLFSAGFLEHFSNSDIILEKWSLLLKPKGKIITIVPNLSSVNGMLMKSLAYKDWDRHIVFSPEKLDEIHSKAGLKILVPASYTGGYAIDYLIPWKEIEKKIPSFVLFKFTRYLCFFLVNPVLRIFFRTNNKFVNPVIYGIYEKK